MKYLSAAPNFARQPLDLARRQTWPEDTDLTSAGRVIWGPHRSFPSFCHFHVEVAGLAGARKSVVPAGGQVGVGDHMELWDTARWETYTTDKKAKYDELAEAAFGYPK